MTRGYPVPAGRHPGSLQRANPVLDVRVEVRGGPPVRASTVKIRAQGCTPSRAPSRSSAYLAR
ncbi:hypothetical protein, partial [Micromonospora sp. 4G55]|uniref:hypothetical protein n=1 Tax=Micromonospora sp. 4G55 TaxID=2806102 RepID=UPI001EE48C92